MMAKQKVLAVVVVAALLSAGSAVQASFFDFEDPPYTAGVLTGNGWTIQVGGGVVPSHAQLTVATAHPYAGEQYVDFALSTSLLDASHAVDTFSDGLVIIEYANYYDGPGASSGKLMATNAAAGDTLIGVGVDNKNGPNWLVAHGAGPTNRLYGMAMPVSLAWFLMRVELDLDSDTADVMWKQTAADPWTPIMDDYATNDFALDGIRLEGRKAAVGFDNVSITPEPMTIALLGLGCHFLAARRRPHK